MNYWKPFIGGIAVSVLACLVSFTVARPVAAEQVTYRISNEDAQEFRYWAQINRIREREETLRARRDSNPPQSATRMPHRYDFEGYAHLRPAFLLYAASEGIAHARKALEGQDPALINRQAYENVGVALQYFPLIAGDADHFQQMIDTLRNRSADPVLRQYIAEQLGSDPHHHSLLQVYMRENLRMAPDNSIRLLRRLSQDPLEAHDIQRAAMRGLFTFIYETLQYRIENDDVLLPFLEGQDLAVGPEVLRRYPDAPTAPETAALVAELQETMQHFVEICIAHLRPEAGRPAETQALALTYLRRIRDELPFEEKDIINDALAAHGESE